MPVKDLTASLWNKLFREDSQNRGRFLLLDTDTERNGWLPAEAWELMQKPRAFDAKK